MEGSGRCICHMANPSKSQFMSRPSIKNLPARERERRWKQHSKQQFVQPSGKQRAHSRVPPASLCDKAYMYSLVNPFDAPPTCVPREPALDSLKLKVFVRGTFTCQTGNGLGYIACNQRFASDQGVGSYTVVTSQSTGTQTGITSSIGSTFSMGFNHNGPYRLVDFTNNDVLARCVSSGIRIRYSGTELNRAGTMYLLEHPTHQNMNNFTIADFSKYERTRICPVTKEWHSVTWQPVTTMEYNYTDMNDYPTSVGHYDLGIMIQVPTAVGSSASFDFEYALNFEAVGEIVRGKTTSVVSSNQAAISNYATKLTSENSSLLSNMGSMASTFGMTALTGGLTQIALSALQNSHGANASSRSWLPL